MSNLFQFVKTAITISQERANGLPPVNKPVPFYDTDIRYWFVEAYNEAWKRAKRTDFVEMLRIQEAIESVLENYEDPNQEFINVSLLIVLHETKTDFVITIGEYDKDNAGAGINSILTSFEGTFQYGNN